MWMFKAMKLNAYCTHVQYLMIFLFFSEEELSQGMVRVTAQQSVIASRELQRVDAQQGKIFFNSLMSSFASTY